MRRALLLLLFTAPSLHAAIRGNTFSDAGAALENASVAVYRPEGLFEGRERPAAGRAREPLATTTTDAKGAFAIDAKLQGVVEVEVARDGYAPWSRFVLAETAKSRSS